jgi:hypothetical protein
MKIGPEHHHTHSFPKIKNCRAGSLPGRLQFTYEDRPRLLVDTEQWAAKVLLAAKV